MQETKGQGTSGRAGYFLAGYRCFPYPDVPGLFQNDPDVRKMQEDAKPLSCFFCESRFRLSMWKGFYT